jgi:exosortase A-associated hydrolase 1
VIWGLCDAASAALFYAHQDRRVSGLVLANPWVRTEQGAARAYLRHYYVKRVLDPELWRKIGRGEFALRGALAGLFALIGGAFGRGPRTADHGAAPTESGRGNENSLPLPDRMAQGLRRFHGPVLLLLSGNDLTAQEFKDLVENSRGWRRLIGSERVSRYDLPEANHTFARREWRDQVARWTAAWVKRR